MGSLCLLVECQWAFSILREQGLENTRKDRK